MFVYILLCIFQRILENYKCTISRCLIHSSWDLRAIYSAIIHGPTRKRNLGPSTPSNGTKKTRSFFGESHASTLFNFDIIALIFSDPFFVKTQVFLKKYFDNFTARLQGILKSTHREEK